MGTTNEPMEGIELTNEEMENVSGGGGTQSYWEAFYKTKDLIRELKSDSTPQERKDRIKATLISGKHDGVAYRPIALKMAPYILTD